MTANTATRSRPWFLPFSKPSPDGSGERILAELDRRLGRSVGRISRTDARWRETLRLAKEVRERADGPAVAAAFSALILSLELQETAARLLDGADREEVQQDKRRVEHVWRALQGLHDAPKAAGDQRVMILRYIEQAKDSELDVDEQATFVIHHVAAASADLASRLDPKILRALLLAWRPKRGRPKKKEAAPPDTYAIAADLLARATGVHVAAGSIRKLWERGRAAARKRI